MKKVFIGILVLLLVGLVVPKIIGNTAYDVYKQSIDNSLMDKGLASIEHREYSSSWFSSDVVTVIKFESIDPKVDTMEWVVASHIQHGPVMFTNDGVKFGLAYVDMKNSLKGASKEIQDVVDNIFNEITIKMTSLIGFDKTLFDEVKVGSYTYDKDGVTATFGGFDVVGTALLDYSKMDGEITLYESDVESPEFTFKIAASSGSYDLRKYFDLMMLGNAKGNIPSLEIVAKRVPVSLENITFSTDETEENKNLYFKQKFAIEKIKAPVPVDALQYDFELNQISLQAIESWVDFSQSFQLNVDGGVSTEDEKKLRELASLALQEGLEMNQYFKLDGMGGALIIDWKTRYVGLPNGEKLWDIKPEDKKKMLQAVDMHILVTIDKSIIDALPFRAVVGPYMKQGFVVEEAGKLKADIKLLRGVLTVNGQPLPIESLFPLLG